MGFSGPVMAAPFVLGAVLLWRQLLPVRWGVGVLGVWFTCAIFLYATAPQNPLIHPVVGETISLSTLGWSVRNEGQLYLEDVSTTGSQESDGHIVYSVSRVTQSHPDFGQRDILHLYDAGQDRTYMLSTSQVKRAEEEGRLLLSEEARKAMTKNAFAYRAQSSWSYYLSMMMAWPLLVLIPLG